MINCHCGKPLHYTDTNIEKQVNDVIDRFGEFVLITSSTGRTYKAPRHYIALHGIEENKLPTYGFEEILFDCDLASDKG